MTSFETPGRRLPAVSEDRRESIACGHHDRFGRSTSVAATLFSDLGDETYARAEVGFRPPPERPRGRRPRWRPAPAQRPRFYRAVLVHCGSLEGMSPSRLALATGLTPIGVLLTLWAPPALSRGMDRGGVQRVRGNGPAKKERDRLIRCGARRGMRGLHLALATGLAHSRIHTILRTRESPR